MTQQITHDQISALMQPCRQDLARLDVASLSVFGSVARAESRDDSDIDVLVGFNGSPTIDRYMDVKLLLERVTGRRIDLVTEGALRPELRSRIVQEAVRVA